MAVLLSGGCQVRFAEERNSGVRTRCRDRDVFPLPALISSKLRDCEIVYISGRKRLPLQCVSGAISIWQKLYFRSMHNPTMVVHNARRCPKGSLKRHVRMQDAKTVASPYRQADSESQMRYPMDL